MTARCFACAARMWQPTDRTLVFSSGRRRGFGFACASCGILCDAPERGEDWRAHLAERLTEGVFPSDETDPFGLDIYTLRCAATGRRLAATPTEAAQARALREPHGALAAHAALAPLQAGDGPGVSLGILCRPHEVERVVAALPGSAAWTNDVVVMVDAAEPPAACRIADARIVARPLAGDFAGQRNALQAFARNRWMLQLDADEHLDPQTGALLSALAAMAERDGAVSIGFPRRNLVDDALSDLFPDVQYRLNRRDVVYSGRVHERPVRFWQRSFIALCGAIGHRLERAHVLSRSHVYEAIAPGGGRLEEASALLAPYRD